MPDLESTSDHDGEPVTQPESPIAAALAQLDTLADRGLAEHADVYQRIHGQLQDALGSIDDA